MTRTRMAGLLGATALFAAAALLTGGPGAAAQGTGCANAGAQPGAVSNAALAASLTCLINAQRQELGLSFLVTSPKLESAERRHVADMLENRYIGHRGTDGSLPAERARHTGYLKGYKFFAVGENLAWGQTTAGTPQRIVNAWMNSASHRRNLVDPRFRQIGTIVEGGSPTGAPGSALDRNAATYGIDLGVVRLRKRR